MFILCFDYCSFTGVDSVLPTGYKFNVCPWVYYDESHDLRLFYANYNEIRKFYRESYIKLRVKSLFNLGDSRGGGA